ncbi:hypothetical protein [Streptomyces caelestis]|uniref:hypothetical protein n=1 Tax=Streptomyces caelestis TaxID=36816 RepID=UPI0036627F30
MLSSQAAVLERTISTETAIEYEHAARRSIQALVDLVQRHLSELGAEGAARLVETILYTAMTAWPSSRPSPALEAAYASHPVLNTMRPDFTDLVRGTAQVTASGLLTRQDTPPAATPAG